MEIMKKVPLTVSFPSASPFLRFFSKLFGNLILTFKNT